MAYHHHHYTTTMSYILCILHQLFNHIYTVFYTIIATSCTVYSYLRVYFRRHHRITTSGPSDCAIPNPTDTTTTTYRACGYSIP